MTMTERGLCEDQRMMRSARRAFVDHSVTAFIGNNCQREWCIEALFPQTAGEYAGPED